MKRSGDTVPSPSHPDDIDDALPSICTISQAASVLGVEVDMLRRLADRGKVAVAQREANATRYMPLAEVKRLASMYRIRPRWERLL